ncbi:MAG: exo-beta-N-acetylmuramidase NamZ domain-containing protein [Bacteroidia bacterium]
MATAAVAKRTISLDVPCLSALDTVPDTLLIRLNMKKLKFMRVFKYIGLILLFCSVLKSSSARTITNGAERMGEYLPYIKDKKIALVVNQTAMVGKKHLVDTLLSLGVQVKLIFAPEHGFRGDHSAGEKVLSSKDAKTGLPIISLYGANKKPKPENLKGIDLVVFDIQDVGARFYTYISTLHYVMEACAEQKKEVLILDRPNPNGFYVDGPVLDTAFRSFVGMHPVPIVHGCTIAEYAGMINGESWLKNKMKCKIKTVLVRNYTHAYSYQLPVRPSPNLPNMSSIYLYPSLCLFEGTSYSLGRGTDKPFECIGKPGLTVGDFYFTPVSISGVVDKPIHENKKCRGFLLSDYGNNVAPVAGEINLSWIIQLYKEDTAKANFFIPFFDQLAGTSTLRKQIIAGKSEAEIRKSWQPALAKYRKMRSKYLLYK